jgi:hypothetical protein
MSDQHATDHLLTCPRCMEQCEPDLRFCCSCGSRLLPTNLDLADARAVGSTSMASRAQREDTSPTRDGRR